MGATYSDHTVSVANAATATDVRKAYIAHQIALRYEYGHDGYTGTLAEAADITVIDQIFDTKGHAAYWIRNNARKWDNALAVKFKEPDGSLHWLMGAICSE